jgi:hypothetical protein
MLEDTRSIIINAFRQLLRGVVRLALRNGLSFVDFSNLSKELYVEIAEHEYGIDGRSTNMSRIALITGINRHEVKRLKEELSNPDNQRAIQSFYRIAGVLTTWHEDERYVDSEGNPLEIPLEGDHPSFNALTQSISVGGDIATVTVLRELKRSQAVEETPLGKLRVLQRHFIPNYHGDPQQAPHFANPNKINQGSSMLVDHINTLFHNLYGKPGEPTRLELRAVNQLINSKDIPAFYEYTNQKSLELLQDIDRWLEEHQDATAKTNEHSERLGLGVYVIHGQNNTKSLGDG